MKVKAKTYSDMTLLLDATINENGRVEQSNVVSFIHFNGIETISNIYEQRFIQDGNDTITYNIAGRELIFDWDYGMQLWDIADQLFWEYQELVDPEIAALVRGEQEEVQE